MKGLSAKSMCATAVVSLAALGSGAAGAAGVEVLNEGFGSLGGLDGWTQLNDSTPPGTGWFQGNPGIFGAQSGAADAYAAANYLGAANGSGSVDNWLITPVLDLTGTTVLSFFTRHDTESNFNDLLEVRFSSGSGSDPSGFSTLLGSVGRATAYPDDWTAFTASIGAEGAGRFAFRYVGQADTLNYVGLDTVSVVTAVPEPAAWMMLAMGLGGFGLLRRASRQ